MNTEVGHKNWANSCNLHLYLASKNYTIPEEASSERDGKKLLILKQEINAYKYVGIQRRKKFSGNKDHLPKSLFHGDGVGEGASAKKFRSTTTDNLK